MLVEANDSDKEESSKEPVKLPVKHKRKIEKVHVSFVPSFFIVFS